jgi:hypothetical protein
MKMHRPGNIKKVLLYYYYCYCCCCCFGGGGGGGGKGIGPFWSLGCFWRGGSGM